MDEEATDRIDPMLTHGRERSTVAELAPSLAAPAPDPAPAPEEALEEEYQKIGWWKGPNATREARARQRDFWCHHGERGLRWLAGRLRREWHIDLLDGVASLLADAGSAGIAPILDELERQPARDQAWALLKALAWIGEEGVEVPPVSAARLEAVLAMLLQHDDTDLREWAADAARLLPRERALRLLRGRLDTEPDADVRQAIEAAIDAGAAGRG
jgi:hypothetical protein